MFNAVGRLFVQAARPRRLLPLLSLTAALWAGPAGAVPSIPGFYSGATYSCYGCHSGPPFSSTTPAAIVSSVDGTFNATLQANTWGLSGNGVGGRTGVRQNVTDVNTLKTYLTGRATLAGSGAMTSFAGLAANDPLWDDLRNYVFDLFDAYVEVDSNPNARILPIGGATTSFGTTVQVGSTVNRTFTIRNARVSDISLNTPTFTGTDAALFSASSYSCTNTSTSGALHGNYADACTVTVTMSVPPGTAAGTKNANLRITFGGTSPAPQTRLLALQATTLAPTISVSPSTTSLSPFAQSAPVGNTVTSGDFIISNGGNGTLTLSPLMSFAGTHAGDYALVAGTTSSCNIAAASQQLTAGSSCRVRISFTPGGAGARSASLSIPNNSGSAATVFLSGFGETRTLSASPVSLDFGSVFQGSSSTSSGVNFTLTNTGNSSINAPTAALSNTLVGDTASDFSRNGGTCGTVGFTTLAPSGSCTIFLRFQPATSPVLAPAATSARAATATFSSSNATNTQAQRVTGLSVGLANPTATVPTAFSATLVGTTSGTTRTITLTNPRANAVTYTLSTGGTNASDFAVTSESCAPGRSVAGGGGSCTITYSFTPALALSNTTRTATATLSLSGSGTDPTPTNSPINVSLAGDATTAPAFAISSTSVTVSSVVNVAAPAVTLNVTNNGTAALVLSSLSLGGTNPGDYSLSGTCANGSSLAGTLAAPRSSCTIILTFTPGGLNARNAQLTIAHNDSNVNAGSTVVTLNGTGNPSLSPVLDLGGTAQLNFGSVPQGQSPQLSFTVRNGNTNVGATSLQLSGLGISGAAAADFTRGGSCTPTTSLAGGASCSVTVTFAPGAAGSRTANLDVQTSNATNAAVALSGTGVALADASLSGVPLAAFPPTLVTTTSATSGTVTVNNPRANTITYSPSFSGTNAGDFLVGSESCATRVVPAGGSCTLQIRFSPANGAAGSRTASLVLAFTGFAADPNPATLNTALSGTAELPAPVFSSSASSLNFSAVVLSPTTGSAVITNIGTANLALTGLSFSGAQASDFRLDSSNGCTATTTLAPSTSCTLVIQYDPAAAGTSAASLSITSNAANSPHSVTLSGTATPTPRPRIALSALSLSFGSLVLGNSGTQNVTVQNVGNAAMNFSSLPISGAAPGDFSRAGSCAVGTALAPAAQCDISVSFAPTAVGSRTASLVVNSDAINGAASVSLSGTGVPVPAPVVTLTAVSGLPLEFGTQTVGGLYPNRRVTLSNTGNANLAIGSVTVEGSGFSNVSTTACPATLAAGGSCDVDISFAPTAGATDFNGNVRVISNAAGSPHLAALHGRGTAAAVPSVVWDPLVSRMDFGQVLAGAVSAVQSATLRNAGPGGLRLTVLNAVGPDAAAFSVTAGSCAIGDVLFEGQTCRVDIRFAPGSSGSKTANVQVASSGSFPSDLALSGVGMGGPNPGLALSVRTLSLGTVRIGAQSAPVELTLSANGSGVVRITAFTVSTGFTLQAKSCPALPFTLQAGSECTVTVVFTPQAVGTATGQLVVSSDATNGTSQQVALNGNGEAPPDLSSGGCSISRTDAPFDPTLALLVLMALAGLAYRRQARRQARRQVRA